VRAVFVFVFTLGCSSALEGALSPELLVPDARVVDVTSGCTAYGAVLATALTPRHVSDALAGAFPNARVETLTDERTGRTMTTFIVSEHASLAVLAREDAPPAFTLRDGERTIIEVGRRRSADREPTPITSSSDAWELLSP
jgi:hypothetical protein